MFMKKKVTAINNYKVKQILLKGFKTALSTVLKPLPNTLPVPLRTGINAYLPPKMRKKPEDE